MAGSTNFTSYAFPVTGASTNRTMPARLSDIKNVRDFGAIPGSDATVGIQAAVNAALAEGGGTVFIPPGTYTISAPITFNTDADFGLCVKGAGSMSALNGAFEGYIFDRKLATPNNTFGPRVFEDLRITNSHALGGAIRLGSTICGGIRNSFIGGGVGFTSEDAAGSSSEGITLEDVVFQRSGGNITGTHGAIIGGSAAIRGCDVTGLETGFRFYGGGISVDGTRMEGNDTAILLGLDSAGVDRGLKGFTVSGMPMEANLTYMDFAGTVTGFLIGPFAMVGHSAINSGTRKDTNAQYGIRIRANKAFAGEIVGASVSSWWDIGAIYIEDYDPANRAYVTFIGTNPAVGGGAGVPWRIPTSTSGFSFKDCNIGSGLNAPSGTRYAFSGLPGASIRLEGDEYDLHDANTATLGASVTAGAGVNRVRVRFNGTNWIVI